ncbi:hypothetical protein D9M69_427140 [compost metagenome]
MVEHVVHRGIRGQVAEVAHRRGGEHHGTDFLEVDAGEHHVLDVGCAGRDDLAAQRTDAHEGAGGELEVFGDAAVEAQAAVDVAVVDPLHRVAGGEEAFVVEGLGGGLGRTPVAGRDVGAAVAHLGLAVDLDQLELDAGGRQAHVARLHVGAGHVQREGARLGHAQAGAHHDALADFRFLRAVQAVPHGLRKRRARVEEHLHARQQVAAQHGVGFHCVGDGFEAGGHVEVDGGRDLAQVAQRLGHAGGRGLAVVDVQRAAVVQHDAHVVVAAEGVVPGQPVDQHRRLVAQSGNRLAQLLLVGAPHAVRVDHRLGHLGRARGEKKLGDGVGAGGLHRRVDGGRGRRGGEHVEARGGAAFERAFGEHDLGAGGHGGRDGLGEARGVGGEHQAGRERVDDVAQLVVVLAHDRIGRRHGAVGHARVEAAQREQRVFDAVLAQDHDRALGVQAAIEQGLSDAARFFQRLRIAHAQPVAGAAVGQALAACDEGAIGRHLRPVREPVGHALAVGLQRRLGREVARARRAVAQHRARHAEGQRAVADGGHPLLTFAPRPSRKSRTRALASGAAWTMPDISASVKKPWSADCSEMRGSACISA